MSNFRDVLRFHRAMGLPIGNFAQPAMLSPEAMRDRIAFMQEELTETANAAAELAAIRRDANNPEVEARRARLFAEVFDGLLDLAYVTFGTGVMMGVPWEKGWNLVQEANMAKERVEKGQGGKDDHHLSIIKPAGWKPPMILELLAAARDGSLDIEQDRHIAEDPYYDEHADSPGPDHVDQGVKTWAHGEMPEHVDGMSG